jgi:hypothetical protein
MYISAVLSNLGAWKKLQTNYSAALKEITDAIESIQLERKRRPPEKYKDQDLVYEPHDISISLDKYFNFKHWLPKHLEEYKYTEIQAVKNDIGITWNFDRYSFNESDLFVKFPLLVQFKLIKLPILLVPMRNIRYFLPQAGSFENLKSRISSITPFPIKYPFVIIGIGDIPIESEEVTELTSDLDQFLVNTIGMSFIEMKIRMEKPAYDFKQILPENKKLARELCAFANLNGGGVILVGVTDSGELIGISELDIDKEQLRVIQAAQSYCVPPPYIDCQVFATPHHSRHRIIGIRIHELERKPCMMENQIFIRRGSSAIAANPDEVREMILGRKMDNTKPDNTWLIA